MMHHQIFRTGVLGLACSIALAGCDRALVYGDRSGFNLAIRQDVTEGSPLEVNAGLQRRVISYVPPRGLDANGNPTGEAANMLARYDYKRTPGTLEKGPFSGKFRLSTSFASGTAAKIAANDSKAAAKITQRPAYLDEPDGSFSKVPQENDRQTALLKYISQSEGHVRAYLALAQAEGLPASGQQTERTRAQETIFRPENAAGNKRIAAKLNL